MSILLVEDEEALASYLKTELGSHGHVVEHVARGDLAYETARDSDYDLLVVDRMLPGLAGLSLFQRLRKQNTKTPVLFLSNLGGLDDRVEGLNAGADDYLAKPFAFSELLARVNALLRRPANMNEQPHTLRLGEFELDRIKRKLTRAGTSIPLQPREWALFEYLLLRRGQIVTRTMLLEGVWGYHFDPKTHIVETHMSRLRSKVGDDVIQTIRGSGYIIRAPQSHA
jgi:two-component system OmpR family response regulator